VGCDSAVDPPSVKVSAISVSPTTLTLTAGGATGTITATVSPVDATNKTVIWTSSDEAVATVVDGEVTAVAEGTATITAKAGDKTATTVVTVNAPVPVVEGTMTAFGAGTVDDDTATFGGVIPWYPADEALQRAEGNRVGVKITIPEGDYDPADIKGITINDESYNWADIKDSETYFEWWPLVTDASQQFTATIQWNSASEQTFTIEIADDATLEAAPIEVQAISSVTLIDMSYVIGVNPTFKLSGNDLDKTQEVKAELYSNDELLATQTYKDISTLKGNPIYLYAFFVVSGEGEEVWATTWETDHPSPGTVPDRVVMTVTDDEGATYTAESNGTIDIEDWQAATTQGP